MLPAGVHVILTQDNGLGKQMVGTFSVVILRGSSDTNGRQDKEARGD